MNCFRELITFPWKKQKILLSIIMLQLKKIEISYDLINQKLAYYNKTFSYKELENAIEAKRKIWIVELQGLVKKIPDFDEVKTIILDAFKND